MRTAHRWIGITILAFALWFSITGLAVQAVDLTALVRHAPATDPDMMAIRESIDGPPNQIVIRPADYGAAAFPPGYDFQQALRRVLASARAADRETPNLRFVEMRIAGATPVGTVGLGDHRIQVAAATGARLPDPPADHGGGPHSSAHDAFKHLHRLFFLGDDMLWLNALVGLGLCAMIVTGLVMYFKLLRARRRMGRRALFWSAGGRWRAFHRGVSLVAAAFLLIVAGTGVLLSIDSLAFGIYRGLYPERLVGGFSPVGTVGDFSAPLGDAQLSTMLATTLRAYRATEGDRPIKVIRLRSFAGMPQGVIVTGGADTRQLIFDAATGARASLSGPGYPYTGFPLGWQLHEFVKKLHRGDVIGIPGRLMAVFAGLSLAFLSVSGMAIYLDLKRRRGKAGRSGLFWR